MQGVKSNPAHKWFCIDKVPIDTTVDMPVDTDMYLDCRYVNRYRYIYFQMRPDQAWLFCQYDSRTRVSSSV